MQISKKTIWSTFGILTLGIVSTLVVSVNAGFGRSSINPWKPAPRYVAPAAPPRAPVMRDYQNDPRIKANMATLGAPPPKAAPAKFK
jgi:hypothetical protein